MYGRILLLITINPKEFSLEKFFFFLSIAPSQWVFNMFLCLGLIKAFYIHNPLECLTWKKKKNILDLKERIFHHPSSTRNNLCYVKYKSRLYYTATHGGILDIQYNMRCGWNSDTASRVFGFLLNMSLWADFFPIIVLVCFRFYHLMLVRWIS